MAGGMRGGPMGGPMGGGTQGENPNQLEQILEIVYIHLGGDRDKVNAWLRTAHPTLGGLQPMELIRQGQAERILEAVQKEVDAKEQQGP